jgi:hypothetical protein
MQSHRTAGSEPVKSPQADPWTGRVLGLGVTDLLRVELEPAQVPSLVEQLAVLRGVCESAVVGDEARWEAIPEFQKELRPASVVEVAKDLDASRFDLRALDIIRSQLGGGDGEDPRATTIIGPSRIIAELVRETTRRVVMSLDELLEEPPRGDADARARLVRVVAAAKAWVETYVECEAVVWSRFEIDPMPTGS